MDPEDMIKEIESLKQKFAKRNELAQKLKEDVYYYSTRRGKLEKEFISSLELARNKEYFDGNPGNFINQTIEKINSINPEAKIKHKIIKKLEKFKSELPNEHEIHYIDTIINELKGFKPGSVAIDDFSQKIKDYIKHLREEGDKETALKLIKAKFARRIRFYRIEERILRKIIESIENDNSDWTYFREKFYGDIKKIAHRFETKYGDTSFKKEILEERKKVHEDRNIWLEFLKQKLNDMESMKDLAKEEQGAIEELVNILSSRLIQLKSKREDIRKDCEKELYSEYKDIKEKRDKTIKEFERIVKRQTELLEGYGALVNEVYTLKDKATEDINKLKRYYRWQDDSLNWHNSLSDNDKKRWKPRIEQMKEYMKRTLNEEQDIYKNLKNIVDDADVTGKLIGKKLKLLNNSFDEFNKLKKAA